VVRVHSILLSGVVAQRLERSHKVINIGENGEKSIPSIFEIVGLERPSQLMGNHRGVYR